MLLVLVNPRFYGSRVSTLFSGSNINGFIASTTTFFSSSLFSWFCFSILYAFISSSKLYLYSFTSSICLLKDISANDNLFSTSEHSSSRSPLMFLISIYGFPSTGSCSNKGYTLMVLLPKLPYSSTLWAPVPNLSTFNLLLSLSIKVSTKGKKPKVLLRAPRRSRMRPLQSLMQKACRPNAAHISSINQGSTSTSKDFRLRAVRFLFDCLHMIIPDYQEHKL